MHAYKHVTHTNALSIWHTRSFDIRSSLFRLYSVGIIENVYLPKRFDDLLLFWIEDEFCGMKRDFFPFRYLEWAKIPQWTSWKSWKILLFSHTQKKNTKIHQFSHQKEKKSFIPIIRKRKRHFFPSTEREKVIFFWIQFNFLESRSHIFSNSN